MKTVDTGKHDRHLLTTPRDVHMALGQTYHMLRNSFDPYRLERPKTGEIASEAFRKRSPVCAACGEAEHSGLSLQAAHIVPVAECGETTERGTSGGTTGLTLRFENRWSEDVNATKSRYPLSDHPDTMPSKSCLPEEHLCVPYGERKTSWGRQLIQERDFGYG